ncbi:MAG: hypothetical protein RR702_06705, partial [Clostridia bacterium]
GEHQCDVRHDKDKEIEQENKKREIVLLIVVACIYILSIFVKGDIKGYLMCIAYILVAFKIISTALKNIFRGNILDETFLMALASLGAIYIGQLEEAIAVLFLYRLRRVHRRPSYYVF